MAHYEVRIKERRRPDVVLRVATSHIRGTNLTRYEVFHGDTKLGGYIDRPDDEYCKDLYRRHLLTWRDVPRKRLRGRAGNVKE